MKVIYSAIVVVFFVVPSLATNYYLSNKGSDSQSGTSALAPWRSLKKLSEITGSLQPGDSIFFERGSIFSGELKISASGKQSNNIHLGAYGSGPKPIVSGAIQVSNWALFRGNIWVADCPECKVAPDNLFIDGHFQSLGRYPNDDYLVLSCASQCKGSLTDNRKIFTDGYWDGAEVVVKSSRWTLDNLLVSNYFNKTFYFSKEASYRLPNGYGYFLQNHLATVDKAGEWYFDKKSNKIYLQCRNGDSPINHVVDVSLTDAGLTLTGSGFVTIENIAFNYQRMVGVQIDQCTDVGLRNCDINYSGNNGVEIISCKSPLVEGCTVKNSNNNGVEWRDNNDGLFLRNSIQSTGLHAGRGGGGNGTYIGLNITARDSRNGNNLFQFNSVDSTGYIGIDFRTGGTTIKNNLISNFCMIKDDGAGIYTWGNTFGRNRVEGNIVIKGIGCGAGTTDKDQLWAHGVYIDDRSSDIDVTGNTVAYCGASGIYIHNAKRISVNGNKLFENANSLTSADKGQLCIKLDALVVKEDKALDLRITENLIATTQDRNHCVYLSAEREQDLALLGMFDQNQYMAPGVNQVVAKFYGHQNSICDALEELSLTEWQRCTERDKKSSYESLQTNEEEPGVSMIRNSQMTNDAQGWVSWPQQVYIVHDKKRGANGPSLRVQFPEGNFEALLYHAGVMLNADKWYRLSFSAMGETKGKIEFVPLMATAPWDALDQYACFSIDTVFRSYTYSFKPNKSFNNARINFKSNGTFWIDNVTLQELKLARNALPWQLVCNPTEKSKIISDEKSVDLQSKPISNPFVVRPYGSVILKKLQSPRQ